MNQASGEGFLLPPMCLSTAATNRVSAGKGIVAVTMVIVERHAMKRQARAIQKREEALRVADARGGGQATSAKQFERPPFGWIVDAIGVVRHERHAIGRRCWYRTRRQFGKHGVFAIEDDGIDGEQAIERLAQRTGG